MRQNVPGEIGPEGPHVQRSGPAGEEVFRSLRAVYAELDRGIAAVLARNAGAGCLRCGTCCTFLPKGDVLYATAPERDFLASVPPPSGFATAEPGFALAAPGEYPEGACPYLRGGKCTARARRTVGCRAHFCASVLPAQEAREECREIGEKALAGIGGIRGIVKEHGIEWDYAPVGERLAARGIGRSSHAPRRPSTWLGTAP